jgi:hypothetical protein
MSIKVFCVARFASEDDRKEEMLGIWREFPGILPIGSPILFRQPREWGEAIELEIWRYDFHENDELWCHCSRSIASPYKPLSVSGDRQLLISDLQSAGWDFAYPEDELDTEPCSGQNSSGG